MIQEGCLVISDISGFTGYLQDSELAHAQETLSALLNLLVEHTQSPLEVVDLEGDAVFSYAPEVSLDQGQAMVEMVEQAYLAFREALHTMSLNTTCTCTACRLIPTLDLKQFVHYGSFARQEIAGHTRLVGHDVNLVHRLLKNSVAAQTGIEAYTAYTQEAMDALRLHPIVRAAARHTENYEDMGGVDLHVIDMHEVWELNRDKVRMRVRPEEAKIDLQTEFAVDQQELWDYIVQPEYRTIFHQAVDQHVELRPDGELGPGGVYVCSHGRMMSRHLILDWDPPHTYTVNIILAELPDTRQLLTYTLAPGESGTRLRILYSPVIGPFPYGLLADLLTNISLPRQFRKGVQGLREAIHAHGDFASDEKH